MSFRERAWVIVFASDLLTLRELQAEHGSLHERGTVGGNHETFLRAA
jgi:hypothetical protein